MVCDTNAGAFSYAWIRAAQKQERSLPIAGYVYFVQVFSALLTVVFIRCRVLTHNSDASTVLPDVADITLHEQPRHIIVNVRWQ